MKPLDALLMGTLALVVTGCSQHYARVWMVQGDVDRMRSVDAYTTHVCTTSGETLDLSGSLLPEKGARGGPHGGPDDATKRPYLVFRYSREPQPGTKRTPSPYLISGGVTGGIGFGAMAVSLITLVPLLGPEGEGPPEWSGPLALAGLGTVAIGSIFFIIGAVAPQRGTKAIPDTITDIGEGTPCAPDP